MHPQFRKRLETVATDAATSPIAASRALQMLGKEAPRPCPSAADILERTKGRTTQIMAKRATRALPTGCPA